MNFQISCLDIVHADFAFLHPHLEDLHDIPLVCMCTVSTLKYNSVLGEHFQVLLLAAVIVCSLLLSFHNLWAPSLVDLAPGHFAKCMFASEHALHSQQMPL